MVRRVPLFVVGLMLLVAACGGASDTDTGGDGDTNTTAGAADETLAIPTEIQFNAAFTCSQITGQTPTAAVPILAAAIERAAALGFSPPELGIALRAECPDSMVVLLADAAVSSLLGS